jgi:hypothetical protein
MVYTDKITVNYQPMQENQRWSAEGQIVNPFINPQNLINTGAELAPNSVDIDSDIDSIMSLYETDSSESESYMKEGSEVAESEEASSTSEPDDYSLASDVSNRFQY